MKSLTTIVAIALFNLLPLTVVHAQGTTKPSEKSAAPAGAGNAPRFIMSISPRPLSAKRLNWVIG
jgi:hypothetical protein